MLSRFLLCAFTGALTACGITSRHTIGPTLDSNGYFGLLFAASIGPALGCTREVAVPVRVGVGVATVETPGGVNDEAVMAIDAGVGVDWLIATPRFRGPFDPTIDLSEEASGAPAGRLGKRLGLRTSYLRVGEVKAWAMGFSGSVLLPLRRNLFSLGLEAGCDVLLASTGSAGGSAAPWFRCDLGLAFDVTNLRAVNPPIH